MGITNDLWINSFARGMKRMSPDKEKELISIYPALFSDLDDRNCIHLFGFECDDGWFKLLKECIQGIKDVCERDHLDIKADQVKEKYAELRFYLSQHTAELNQVIEKAETKAVQTCEICGCAGKIKQTRPNWWKTLCEKCFTK